MILWKPYGEGMTGVSVYIQHCAYRIREIRGTGTWEVKQLWTGKNTEILLKCTRARGLEEAKWQCNDWDANYA